MKYFLLLILAAGCSTPPPPQSNKVDRGYVTVGKLRMYYEKRGFGHPLVLIPGGGSTISATYSRLIPFLSKNHQVIAIEEQGHGHTADIDRPLSFEQTADDVVAVLHHIGIEKADVMGFSNGGNSALQIALRHPSFVRKLILASTFTRKDGIVPKVRDSFKNPPSVQDMPKALRDSHLKVAPHKEDLPELVKKLSVRMSSIKDIGPIELKQIKSPTLIMMGDRDMVTAEHALNMFRWIPRVGL